MVVGNSSSDWVSSCTCHCAYNMTVSQSGSKGGGTQRFDGKYSKGCVVRMNKESGALSIWGSNATVIVVIGTAYYNEFLDAKMLQS